MMGALRRAALLFAWALLVPVACGGGAVLDDPLAPVPIDVDPRDVAPPPLRIEWRTQVQALNPASGEREPRVATTAPAIDARHAYVVYDDVMQARALADGTLAWSARFSESISLAPMVSTHGVIVATGALWSWIDAAGVTVAVLPVAAAPRDAGATASGLVTLDETGVYRVDVTPSPRGPAPSESWRTDLENPVALSLGPDGARAYVTTGEGAVVALDTAAGAVVWRSDDAAGIARRVAVDATTVYVAGRDGVVRALRASDGRQRWAANRLGVSIASAPAALNGIVWVAALDAGLHGFAAGNGSALFRVRLAARTYVDLALAPPWVLASPLYGPWTFVRPPTRPASPQSPGVPAIQAIRAERGISLGAAIGAAGIVLVDDVGYVQLVRPEPRDAARSTPEQ